MIDQNDGKYIPQRNSITIMQWNARSLIANGAELEKYIEDLKIKPDVICIQETWLNNTKSVNLKNYKCFREDRMNGRRGGGVANFVRETIPAREIKLAVDPAIECTAVEIILRDTRLSVCNIYHAELTTTTKMFQDVVKQLPSTPLICGDFNGHNPIWGSETVDHKGTILEKWADEDQLIILNDRKGTRISPEGKMSSIDLALTHNRLASKCSWSIDHTTTIGSDHFPITIGFRCQVNRGPTAPESRWNIRKADWEKFKSLCTIYIDEKLISEDVDIFTKNFTTAISICAEKSIPTTKPMMSREGVPWWNENCQKALKQKREALNRVRRTRVPDDHAAYIKARNICSSTIRRTKRDFWREYCDTIDKNTTNKELWNKIKLMSRDGKAKPSTFLLDKTGNVICDPEDRANLIANFLSTASSNSNLPVEFLTRRESLERNFEIEEFLSDNDSAPINDPFHKRELIEALDEANDTAPGEDRVTVSMLRNLPDSAIEILLQLINLSWKEGKTPADWKHSLINPIPKPQKNPTTPEAYRPIALTSCICKIAERMIKRRMQWLLESNSVLSPYQSGFRKQRGTMDNVIRLENAAQLAIQNGRYTIAVLLDLEKAYDLMWTKGLFHKLLKIGINGNSLRWFKSFLTGRSFQVKVENKKSKRIEVTNGTPQGSVISPLLFTVMLNAAAEQIEKTKIGIYADDIVIWYTSKNLEFLKKIVEKEVNAVTSWLSKWGFKISKEKTSAVVFTRRKIPASFCIEVEGVPVIPQKTAKLLGIVFDRRLTWNDHVTATLNKCKKSINIMKRLCGTEWGAHPKQQVQLYKALIRSKLEYGAEVIESAAQSTKKD